MIKNKILNILTRLEGKKYNCIICKKSFLTGNFYKNHFDNCQGTKEFPIEIRESRIVGNVQIGRGCKILNSNIHASQTIKIGCCSSLNATSVAQFINEVTIGNYCSIAAGTKIIESNHRMDRLTTYHFHQNILKEDVKGDLLSKGAISIADDVWIGSNVVILSGVHIGRGAIIGAGSVVTKDIPPYTICVGNPAREIAHRFDRKTISLVEASQWWINMPEKLKEKRNWFDTDISSAVEIIKQDI